MKAKERFLCWCQDGTVAPVTKRATVNLLAETGTRASAIIRLLDFADKSA